MYGASNTGKSFALKSLDFMLGGGTPLPVIKERDPYNKLWLDIAFSAEHRAVARAGHCRRFVRLYREATTRARTLAPKHDANSPNNISTFLLAQMDAAGRKVSTDASGTHSNLSFRDIAGIVLTNELAIQSENSPIESGDTTSKDAGAQCPEVHADGRR